MLDLLYSLPLLQIHVTAVFCTLALVLIADAHGLLWISGKIQTLPQKRMQLLHRLVWLGLGIIILSGAIMFYAASDYFLTSSTFIYKMAFVATLIANATVIGKHLHIISVQPFTVLDSKYRCMLLLSGAVSTSCWIGAFVIARFIGL